MTQSSFIEFYILHPTLDNDFFEIFTNKGFPKKNLLIYHQAFKTGTNSSSENLPTFKILTKPLSHISGLPTKQDFSSQKRHIGGRRNTLNVKEPFESTHLKNWLP